MPRDVFISHSAHDRVVAEAICTAIEGAGIKCWVAPRDVRPGRSFAGEITRAIRQSKVMVLVFSGHSNKSEQVLREVQLATDCHLPIVQFRIENVALTDDLTYFLSTPHWLDALTEPLSPHIVKLEAAVKELLGQLPAESETKLPPPLPVIPTPSRPAAEKSAAPNWKPFVIAASVLLAIGLAVAIWALRWADKTETVATNLQPTPDSTSQVSPSPVSVAEAPSPLMREKIQRDRSESGNRPADADRSDIPSSKNDSQSRKDAENYYRQSLEFVKKEQYDAAITASSKAIEINPDYWQAYVVRGTSYAEKGDLDQAIADFSEVIRLNPNDPNGYRNRSIAYANKREKEKAQADLNEAKRLETK